MKKEAMKLVSYVFILLGVGLLLYPLYTNWQVKQTQEELTDEWDELNSGAFASAEEVDSDEVSKINTHSEKIDEKTVSGNLREVVKQKNLVGKISIPKIELEAMIVPGVDQQSLKTAVGWMTSTALPDEEGNMVLAGHRSHTYGKFFNRLGEIEIGDSLTIESYSGEHFYRVTDIKVVKPTNTSVIQPSGGKTVTLITCHPLNSNRFRLIIKAEQQQESTI